MTSDLIARYGEYRIFKNTKLWYNVDDGRRSISEGWYVSEIMKPGTIRKTTHVGPRLFADDASAEAYVRERADKGSEFHQRALMFIAWIKMSMERS